MPCRCVYSEGTCERLFALPLAIKSISYKLIMETVDVELLTEVGHILIDCRGLNMKIEREGVLLWKP